MTDNESTIVPGKYVTLPQVQKLLEDEMDLREDLTYEQKLALDHASHFTRIPPEQVEELVGKLTEVGDRVTQWHAYKIADVGPTHEDDVRAIFQKDRIMPEPDEINKILEIVAGYL